MRIIGKTKTISYISALVMLLFVGGCGQTQVSSVAPMSSIDRSRSVALYALENYTDTPRAGMRASNLVEGLLLAKGYRIDNRVNNDTRKMTQQQKRSDALSRKNGYMFIGGVSEWRYKTGIDGEPAVSLQFKLIDLKTGAVKWSAVASDSSWGNASIGTVAQDLISSMLSGKQ